MRDCNPEKINANGCKTQLMVITGGEKRSKIETQSGQNWMCSCLEDLCNNSPTWLDKTKPTPQRPDLDATLDYTNDDRNPPASPPGSPVVVHEQPARAPPHGIPIVEVAQNLGHIPRPQPQQATSMDIEFRCGRTNDRMIARGCPFTIFQVAEAFRINILQPNLEFELNALRNNLRPPAAQPPTMLIDGNIREHRTQDIMEPEHTADV